LRDDQIAIRELPDKGFDRDAKLLCGADTAMAIDDLVTAGLLRMRAQLHGNTLAFIGHRLFERLESRSVIVRQAIQKGGRINQVGIDIRDTHCAGIDDGLQAIPLFADIRKSSLGGAYHTGGNTGGWGTK
jgi:hypothetical protein